MSGRTYLTSGRVNQKHRTREALLDAAAELIRAGRNFSIGEVADIAKVGRTTAYRYFPSIDLLVAHAALWKVAGQEQSEFEARFERCETPFDRVEAVVLESDRSTNEHKNEFRAMLRVSLEQGGDDKEHRSRIRYFVLKKALEGLQEQLGKGAFERVVCALSLTVGVEAQIVLRDICLLSGNAARDVKLWAARAILKEALAEVASSNREKAAPPSARRGRLSTGGKIR